MDQNTYIQENEADMDAAYVSPIKIVPAIKMIKSGDVQNKGVKYNSEMKTPDRNKGISNSSFSQTFDQANSSIFKYGTDGSAFRTLDSPSTKQSLGVDENKSSLSMFNQNAASKNNSKAVRAFSKTPGLKKYNKTLVTNSNRYEDSQFIQQQFSNEYDPSYRGSIDRDIFEVLADTPTNIIRSPQSFHLFSENNTKDQWHMAIEHQRVFTANSLSPNDIGIFQHIVQKQSPLFGTKTHEYDGNYIETNSETSNNIINTISNNSNNSNYFEQKNLLKEFQLFGLDNRNNDAHNKEVYIENVPNYSINKNGNSSERNTTKEIIELNIHKKLSLFYNNNQLSSNENFNSSFTNDFSNTEQFLSTLPNRNDYQSNMNNVYYFPNENNTNNVNNSQYDNNNNPFLSAQRKSHNITDGNEAKYSFEHGHIDEKWSSNYDPVVENSNILMHSFPPYQYHNNNPTFLGKSSGLFVSNDPKKQNNLLINTILDEANNNISILQKSFPPHLMSPSKTTHQQNYNDQVPLLLASQQRNFANNNNQSFNNNSNNNNNASMNNYSIDPYLQQYSENQSVSLYSNSINIQDNINTNYSNQDYSYYNANNNINNYDHNNNNRNYNRQMNENNTTFHNNNNNINYYNNTFSNADDHRSIPPLYPINSDGYITQTQINTHLSDYQLKTSNNNNNINNNQIIDRNKNIQSEVENNFESYGKNNYNLNNTNKSNEQIKNSYNKSNNNKINNNNNINNNRNTVTENLIMSELPLPPPLFDKNFEPKLFPRDRENSKRPPYHQSSQPYQQLPTVQSSIESVDSAVTLSSNISDQTGTSDSYQFLKSTQLINTVEDTSNNNSIRSSLSILIDKSNITAEFIESPRSKLAYKEFSKQFRIKEKESYEAAKSFASQSISHARHSFSNACISQPRACMSWLEWSKMEEENGKLRKSLDILILGLMACKINEALLTRVIKLHERLHHYVEVRGMLSVLKYESIDKVWKSILEGSLFEARTGNIIISRKLFKFLIKHVSWYGPIYFEAFRLEEKENQDIFALQIIKKGLKELPRYGPLWFGLMRIVERIDGQREKHLWSNGYKPQLIALRKEVNEAIKNISKELTWKVYFEFSQAEERAAEIASIGMSKKTDLSLKQCRNLLLEEARISLVKSLLVCPENLRWKIFLVGSRLEAGVGAIDKARYLLCRAFAEVPQKSKFNVYLELSRLEEYIGDIELARNILYKARQEVKSQWKVFLESILLEARAAKEKIIRQAIAEVPKSGEVWCERGRCHLNPLNTKSFDLSQAQRSLCFAIQFTPQYGDTFIEYIKLEMLMQIMLPIVLKLLNLPVLSFYKRFLWGDSDGDLYNLASEGRLMNDLKRYDNIIFENNQKSEIDRQNRQLKIIAIETLTHDFGNLSSAFSAIAIKALNRRCVNADPNYGSAWFFCRLHPSDIPSFVLSNAVHIIVHELVSSQAIYGRAILHYIRNCLQKEKVEKMRKVDTNMMLLAKENNAKPRPSSAPRKKVLSLAMNANNNSNNNIINNNNNNNNNNNGTIGTVVSKSVDC
eukprot:gene11499-15404_t